MSKFGVSVLSIAYPVMNALSFFVGCKMDMTRLTSSVPETQVNTACTCRKHTGLVHEG